MMPNSDLKALGEKVRTERKLAGLTQEQLAERCHVSTKHIANIEKGSMNPSYEILLAIARVLPVSLDALITPGMGKTEIELKEFNRIYLSCPEAVRETLMDSTRTLAKHLTEFYSRALPRGKNPRLSSFIGTSFFLRCSFPLQRTVLHFSLHEEAPAFLLSLFDSPGSVLSFLSAGWNNPRLTL